MISLHACSSAFDRLAAKASAVMGSLVGFCAMVGFVLACVALGPWVGWLMMQVILTTTLTVITQLTAMLLFRAEERSERALQIKIDELIKSIPDADNRLRGIEREER